MVPELNEDCLSHIFNYLRKTVDDIAILYPCALVNRSWCKASMPILWSDPWAIRNYRGSDSDLERRRELLINAYISNLPQNSKDSLSKIQRNIKATQKTSAFDYASFLKHLNLKFFGHSIKVWIDRAVKNGFINHDSQQIIHYLLIEHVTKLLLTRSTSLRSLDLRYCDDVDMRDCLEILASVLESTNDALDCLIYLKDFKYSGSNQVMPRIFASLTSKCQNIKHLGIYGFRPTDNFINFIDVQKNLNDATISYAPCGRFDSSFSDWSTNEFVSEKSKSIIRLSVENIFNFANLEELYLRSFDHIFSREGWEPLARLPLKRLKTFYFQTQLHQPFEFLDIFAKFVENTSGELRHITFLTGLLNLVHLDTRQFITSIATNCPFLEVYEGPMMENNTEQLALLLEKCTKLRALHIYLIGKSDDERPTFDFLLSQLSSSLAPNLEFLKISGECLVYEETVSSFFNVRRNLAKKINFHWGEFVECVGNVKDVCKTFQELGVVKKFGLSRNLRN
ncbi:14731_t:CDS:2 [Dentiscutata erythropus]|uniref:14731_t:CDS:1 n=1 Tax=Dentiscutata erythropus TaxID=1348616 RepID=A0A9N8VZF2_9GLOM|nr:14731_t:CDS:2 [Dentiscutata erythropus]